MRINTSFISEHSAEFILVPNFIKTLKENYSKIIPIYFWISREGSLISKMCDDNSLIRTISLYPRRPKILNPKQGTIQIKFSKELFDFSIAHEELGIPVMAGVPGVSTILDLTIDSRCFWFKVTGAKNTSELEFNINIKNDNNKINPETGIIGPLNETQVLSIVKNAKQFTWREVIDKIISIRHYCIERAYFSKHIIPFFGLGSYKPIYFLIL